MRCLVVLSLLFLNSSGLFAYNRSHVSKLIFSTPGSEASDLDLSGYVFKNSGKFSNRSFFNCNWSRAQMLGVDFTRGRFFGTSSVDSPVSSSYPFVASPLSTSAASSGLSTPVDSACSEDRAAKSIVDKLHQVERDLYKMRSHALVDKYLLPRLESVHRQSLRRDRTCIFDDAHLPGAHFDYSYCQNVSFKRAFLAGASFVGADCRGADFTDVCVRHKFQDKKTGMTKELVANFSDAILTPEQKDYLESRGAIVKGQGTAYLREAFSKK